ncbi:MAG: DUF2298 domain-containing protein [Chloroflexota bacterium]|nr:DUF2298 domain-containing protein [Chloroflexota bacterium]
MAYVILWWLALELIGLVSFPLVSRVCVRLKDKGYAISKIFGLLFLTFLTWLFSSIHLLQFGYAGIILSLAVLAALSLYFGRENLKIKNWPRKQMLTSELVFAVSFIAFLLVMWGEPDIFYGGADYFMDFAFMNSILQGGYFPPVDPWFAGETLPYYYGGHLSVASLTMLTNVPPEIAFNIAVAMFFALTASASYGLGYNLTGRRLYGVLTLVFVCFTGFLTGTYQLIGYVYHTSILGAPYIEAPNIAEWMMNFDFWSAPWVLPGAMAQYPYYTFLAGTLHAFMMSIPFQLMFITLVYALFKRSRGAGEISRADTAIEIAVLGVCLGFFSIVNTWEYPVYAIFLVAAYILLRMRRGWKSTFGVPAAIIAVSLLLYLPYFLTRGMGGVGGIDFVVCEGMLVIEPTDFAGFFEAIGLFLFLILSLLVVLPRWGMPRIKESIAAAMKGRLPAIIAAIAFLSAILVAVFTGLHVLIAAVPMILVPLYYIFRKKTKSTREFVLLLVLIGGALALFCELFYIDDMYGQPWERFNTVFKIYVPLWIFLGISSAYAVFYFLRNTRIRWVKAGWIVVLAAFIIAICIHPIASTVSATGGRQVGWGLTRGTLDGMAYLETIYEDDYAAIKWLNENIDGSHVILEAPGAVFQYTSRVSTFTGLPTVIGWTSWEVMWRGDFGAVEDRERDVNAVYNASDNVEAIDLLQTYDVRYIYIGSVERDRYTEEGLQKFADLTDYYSVVYENGSVAIYEVLEE